MKNENYWDQFMQSGRIDDYLHFKEEGGRLWEEDMFSGQEESADMTKGENPNAGFYHRDGDGFKDGACR